MESAAAVRSMMEKSVINALVDFTRASGMRANCFVLLVIKPVLVTALDLGLKLVQNVKRDMK